MELSIHATRDAADRAAANCLMAWLVRPDVLTLMAAGGNTPIAFYQLIAEEDANVCAGVLARLSIFTLDEYVGVPLDEPRNCANLIRRTLVDPWRIAPDRFYFISSLPHDALESVQVHEQRIEEIGGLDVVILGLGQNGHLGFNEPGSSRDSVGRIVELEPSSVEANRKWFAGDYAPDRGVTVGMHTILAARHILIMAYGDHKAAAVHAMIKGPVTERCPASFLQTHADVHVFLDAGAADKL
jgi:glucosamine-6-phosphate deaminase